MIYSERHQAARDLAKANIPPFPLEVNGKKPVTPNGFYDATTDLAQIDKWWSEADYNIGIPTGEKSKLLVIDCDPGSDVSKLNLPKTYTVRSPRGTHYYFVGSGKTSASKLGPHIDTRGEVAYIVAPYSVINGKSYEIIDDCAPVPLPKHIAALLEQYEPEKRTAQEGVDFDTEVNIRRAEEYLKRETPAIRGHGSDGKIYQVVCKLKDYAISDEKSVELIWGDYIPRCSGHFDEWWIREKVINAHSYGQNEPGCDALKPTQEVFGPVIQKIYADAHNDVTNATKADTEKSFIYIRDREAQLNSPSAEMQVETILPYKKLILPWGATDAGKTYWSVELVTAIAMNRPAFGCFNVLKPGMAVIFAGEDSDRLEQSRLTAIEQYHKRSLQGLVYTAETAIPLDDLNLFEKYCDELRRLEKKTGEKIAVILNDTLKRSLGSHSPNDAETGQLFTSVMEKIINEFGCTMIVNAHQPKSGPENGIAGTQGFVDNAPVTPHLIRVHDKPFEIKCEFEPKFRVGPRPEAFIVRGNPVLLPKPVAGVLTDLVFAALSPEETKKAGEQGAAMRGDREELQEALDRFNAHTLATGLTTTQMAEAIAGDPKGYVSDDDYKQAVGKRRDRLDNGCRVRRKGGRARYEGWFDRDFRFDAKRGEIKWFCPSPEERTSKHKGAE